MITLTNHPIFGCHWKEINFYRKIRWAFSVLPTSQRDRQSRECRIPKTANYTQLPAVAWKKQKNFKTGFIFKKAYGSYDELLEDPEVRSSLYSSAQITSQRMGLKGSRSQKTHSLRERISGSAKRYREMIQACKDAGVILMEAFAYLHCPLMQKLKLQIDQD